MIPIRQNRLFLKGAASFSLIFLFVLLIVPRETLLEGVSFSNAYFSREGELLKIYPSADGQFRLYTHISNFPPDFLRMILLQEDRFFYRHPGVNPVSLFKAFLKTYVVRNRRIGGSTITMQLARLRFGLNSRTIPGKMRQILYAFYMECVYSKQDILEAYLNLAPCGGNIQGFPAASLLYFNRPLSELTLGETLLLCILPQDPLGRNPRKIDNREEILQARNSLYERWKEAYPEEDGKIYHPNLLPAIQSGLAPRAMHATEMLQLSGRNFGSMKTTIAISLQDALNQRLERYIERLNERGVRNGAALILDYRTMDVLALVGSVDFFNNSIQGMVNGTASRRSPGSTLKPFIYALAMDQGLIHSETILYDRPISFSTYSPDNYKRDFKGPVPAWNALVNSRNIPAVELASKLRNPTLYDLLKSAPAGDLKDESHYGLSIVLGSAELSMLELTGLYAAFGNQGTLKDIRISSDYVLQDFTEQRLFSPQAASIVRKMLERNPPPGEGFQLSGTLLPGEGSELKVAYKTGTSIGFKDAWSMGLYGPYVIAVWIGNFDGEGNPAFLGRETATPFLFEVTEMLKPLVKEEDFQFDSTPGVQDVQVCSVSGAIPSPYCSHTIPALFIPGVSPIRVCEIHRPIIIDEASGFRVTSEGEGTKTVIREVWPSDMLKLFDEAGVPRPVPPPFEQSLGSGSGGQKTRVPRIVSPLERATYILRPDSGHYRRIPLIGAADGEVREMFWFANGVFLGKSEPKKTLYWEPVPGTYNLILLDDRGFSTDRMVSVTMEP